MAKRIDCRLSGEYLRQVPTNSSKFTRWSISCVDCALCNVIIMEKWQSIENDATSNNQKFTKPFILQRCYRINANHVTVFDNTISYTCHCLTSFAYRLTEKLGSPYRHLAKTNEILQRVFEEKMLNNDSFTTNYQDIRRFQVAELMIRHYL